ncbi:RNA polymerase sigma-70 factor [Dysgonomonas sp. 521]|uniref:RNA polymerase sigma-70 factor n=1 Tax=Dysgonomonas sp. 521 TaxID=2302932 RepID=UPI0013D87FD1|nr:RNA polymerase sigma-70 factor [Dysgonomonas sp. 521]NDV96880.1 RNA polymerase sigma-70 factor [Dysgonomonas sp. 521]
MVNPVNLTFNSFYTKYYNRFVRFANSYVRNMDAAEDFTTEAFMVYWGNKDSLAPDSNIEAYILTVIKNKCLNYLKQEERRKVIVTDISDYAQWELDLRISTLEACDPDEVFSEEIQRIVNETLAKLPKQTLDIFVQSRYKEKPHKEIAEMFNITTKGVEYHISKALSVLRLNLKDYLPAWTALFFILNK